MKKLRLVGVIVDPCLYLNKSKKVVEYVALYINDNLMVGNSKAIMMQLKPLMKMG